MLTPGRIRALGIAAAGCALFWALGLPLPFLLGPLAACLLAALSGVQMQDTGRFGVGMRSILGVAVGASLTPELLERLPAMALSLALVPLFVLLIGTMGYLFFRRFHGYDPATAYYCAMPGGFQDMVIFGQEAGGNIRTLALVHATRVAIIVSVAPFLITGLWDTPLTNAPGEPVTAIGWDQLAVMAFAALAGWGIAARIRLFGASILGPLILSAVLSMTGILTTRPPAEAIIAAQFFIGLGIGAQYVGVTLAELRRDVLAGAQFMAVLAVVTLIFAEAVALAGLAPSLEAFLAFAPGGQAEMVVLTLVAGADLAFVITHHLARIMLVILGAPVIAHLMRRYREGDD